MTAGNEFLDLWMPTHRQARQPHAESEWPADDRVDLAALIEHCHPAWHRRANCRGQTGVMYGENVWADAQTICHGCPVQTECFEAGIGEVFGTWAGLSARQRVKLRKQRRNAA